MQISQIKETCLYVSNLDEAKKFYHDLLGFEVINHQVNRFIFFRVGTSVLLCFNPESSRKNDSPPAHFAHGPQHIAFEVKPEDYSAWKIKVTKLNIGIIDEITWKNGLKSFYFIGPEKHILEIVPKGVWDA